MKALFLSPSLSRQAGGIFEIMHALARHLAHEGTEIEAMGLNDSAWDSSQSSWDEVCAAVFPGSGPKVFGYSTGLRKGIMESQAEVLHLHALWMYPSILTQQWHRKTGRPYVVTPNGMLEPWALANSAWKKRVAGSLYERRMLAGAACLQANTGKEMEDFRRYGLQNPVAVIPNGVELPCLGPLKPAAGRKNRLLFLGRLHPKKGLIDLLKAWARGHGRGADWQLVIAGWDQGGHEMELKRCCDDLRLPWTNGGGVDSLPGLEAARTGAASVVFAGPVFGEIKQTVLEQADAFILPSFSEGLPISVLEAWAYGLPVLMTPECNLPEGVPAGAALEIGAGGAREGMRDRVASIHQSLGQLIEMSPEERHAMGAAGRRLVENRFSWPQVARQMTEVYQWVAGGGPKPDTVL